MKVIFITKRNLFIFWLIFGILLGALFILKIIDDNSIAAFGSPVKDRTVVIDPGHGGFDPGAVSNNGIREDRINLSIAKKLSRHLDKEGAKVIMTRTSNDGVRDSLGSLIRNKSSDMQRRVDIIKDSNAHVVISIHLNKFSQSQYYGAQTFYMRGSSEGEKLAASIQAKLIEVLDRGNKREIKAADSFRMLRASGAPAVIVECGFLSNPEEEKLLQDDKYQDDIAWAIYSGVTQYFTGQ